MTTKKKFTFNLKGFNPFFGAFIDKKYWANKKKFKFNKKRNTKRKQFIIRKYYTKSIPFVYKEGAKIKKYYSKSIPFVYYTRKTRSRRRFFFFGTTWRYIWRRGVRLYIKKKHPIRVWYWRKKKIKKQRRLWHNFFFFFKQHWVGSFFKYKLKRKWLGKGKKLDTIVPRYQPKKKLILRFKDTYKKKLYFKKFLVKYYGFRRIRQLKNLYTLVDKKSGNRITNLFMHLESQLSSICVRMYFFFNLYKARLWINVGVVYVNGRRILYFNHLIKLNDLLTVLFWRSLFRQYKKHRRSLNYSELNFKSKSGILFCLPYRMGDLRLTLKKKKKYWIKARVFAFLVNSFH